MKLVLIKFTILILLFSSCKDEPTVISQGDILALHLNLPPEVLNYSELELPPFFKEHFIKIQNNTPSTNPTTDWGATLGRVLFYDKKLSKNRTIACASCHRQEFGFADTSQFSTGFEGKQTPRHSMALANAVYYSNGRFFWDERAVTLENQVLHPIVDSIEMGMNIQEVIDEINNSPFYPILFQNAFGSSDITEDRLAKALAQFVRSMVSYTSKYDQGRALVNDRIDDFPNFTNTENAGKNIFMTNRKVNCFGCHNTDAFITDNPRNNGLYSLNFDDGIFIHTQRELDRGKFKTPSLKNVAVRGRFMHDGSFSSLREVIEHYNSGIQMNPNLDSHLINVSDKTPVKMNLSNEEVEQLLAFLHTLTDKPFLNDVKYSNPFK